MSRILARHAPSLGGPAGSAVPCAGLLLLLPLLLSIAPAWPLSAQATPRAGAGPQVEVDSAQAVSDARRAQERFERVRRNNAPWTNRSWSGPCDETIGRFCIWHTPGSDWTPPDDPPAIADARERLLDELEAAAEAVPGDAWVLGQRVRYLGEADRWVEAVELADACEGGDEAWCRALAGFALHNSGRYAAAEEAFFGALRAMPVEEAAAWRDPTLLLDRDGQRLLQRAEADEGDELRDRIWWLGDPLYLIPGNERWTEHLARHVMAVIQEEARNPHGLRWGDDMTEIVLRFGWSVGWERIRPAPFAPMTSTSVVGRERSHSMRFLPPGSALARPEGVRWDDWRLDDARPRSKYASREVKSVEALPHQVAIFPRREGLLVVGTYELPRDAVPESVAQGTEGAANGGGNEGGAGAAVGEGREREGEQGAELRSGFFLVPAGMPLGGAPLSAARAGDGAGPDAGRAFSAVVPRGDYILSLEVLDSAAATAWRHRREVRPADRVEGVPVLSDLLLHHVRGDEPRSVEEAAPRALGSSRVSRGDPLGVAWEIYELGAREALTFRITLEPEEGGRLRRLGEWMGLVDAPSPVVLGWTETGPEWGERYFRSAQIDLEGVGPGRYTLRLEVGLHGRTPIRASRILDVLP